MGDELMSMDALTAESLIDRVHLIGCTMKDTLSSLDISRSAVHVAPAPHYAANPTPVFTPTNHVSSTLFLRNNISTFMTTSKQLFTPEFTRISHPIKVTKTKRS